MALVFYFFSTIALFILPLFFVSTRAIICLTFRCRCCISHIKLTATQKQTKTNCMLSRQELSTNKNSNNQRRSNSQMKQQRKKYGNKFVCVCFLSPPWAISIIHHLCRFCCSNNVCKPSNFTHQERDHHHHNEKIFFCWLDV